MTNIIRGKGLDTTESELHVYADGTSGNDSNDGYSVSTPKKTLQAVFDLVPSILRHHTCVHLSGVFTLTASMSAFYTRIQESNVLFLIDGGDDTTTVAGPFTATGGSDYTIVVAGAGWATDAHMGYWVEITGGTGVGQVFQAQKNTSDTITTTTKWATNPQAGSTFNIVRPSTEITSTTSGTLAFGGTNDWNYIELQRLYLSGTKVAVVNRGGLGLRGVISASSSTSGIYLVYSGYISNYIYDPATWSGFTNIKAGLSVLNAAHRVRLFDRTGGGPIVSNAPVNLYRCTGNVFITYGSRIKNAVKIANTTEQGWDTYNGFMGYNTAPIEITNPTGVGLTIVNSSLNVGGWSNGFDISNCGSHAIEAETSKVRVRSYVTGSGNTGAGVYAHSGSVVHITDGSPPTLTGTVGDLSTDGTTQKSTWAAIDGGTPVSDTAEMTMAKEVP